MERRRERCEKVAALLVGALAPVTADMLSGEEISILVRPNTEISLAAGGSPPRSRRRPRSFGESSFVLPYAEANRDEFRSRADLICDLGTSAPGHVVS
jgi:hypothetical protein